MLLFWIGCGGGEPSSNAETAADVGSNLELECGDGGAPIPDAETAADVGSNLEIECADGGEPSSDAETGADVGPNSPAPCDIEASTRLGASAEGDSAPDPCLDFAIRPIEEAGHWAFYGGESGLPSWLHGVTSDASGNIWVAGGTAGLFLLRPHSAVFERFGLEHGLTPFAESMAHPGPIATRSLDVIAVTGGEANTAFVGYRGLSNVPDTYGCEDNWDGPAPVPEIYKSGDADRVQLDGNGSLRVTHYDISSGENVVAAEPRGREKICDVYRILFDGRTRTLWFGGNHGYAQADPDFEPSPGCTGQPWCSGVFEHAHPLLNGYNRESSGNLVALTNAYFGLTLAANGDLWVGGWFRSQRCAAKADGRVDFWQCESEALSSEHQIDWWPDAVAESSRPSERTDDHVSALAAGTDGAIWVGSSVNGLLRRGADASHRSVEPGALLVPGVSALVIDPLDGSLWVGGTAGGLTRLKGKSALHYSAEVFGAGRISNGIADIQIDRSGSKRRILVAFRNGSVGIYSGD
jgi:hypothetical protein